MILSELIWIFFIGKGYINLGRLPNYGDPEVVSFNGLDRMLVIYSFGIMLCGSLIWITITIINYFVKMYIINNRTLVFGVITILFF